MGFCAPLDEAISVSIVIVSWNTIDVLRGCLASIQAQTQAQYQIIVVDNASSDGSADMVAGEFPEAELIRNTGNHGFAAANNQGIRQAAGQHILLLNPDTIILDGAIDTMLGWLAAHPDVGCVGCQVLEDKTTIQHTCFADLTPFSLILIESGLSRFYTRFSEGQEYSGWDRRSERDVDVVSGMFMLVPRAVAEKVGPLDEAFFIYAEEADWCRRIRDAGYRCVFAPAARIVHLDGGSKSTAQIRPRMYVQLQRSKLIYVRKHYGATGYLFTRMTMFLVMLLRYLVFRPMGVLTGSADHGAVANLARVSMNFLVTGRDPT